MKPSTRWSVGAASLAVAIGLAGCTATPADDGPRSLTVGVTTIAVSNSPLEFGHLLFMATQPTYETLWVWNQVTNVFEPWLAEEYELSDDRKSLSIKLREDVDFTDGAHFDAAAVKKLYDLGYESDAIFISSLRDLFGLVVEATGEYTLEFTTEKPMDSSFFEYVSYTQFASPDALDDPESLVETPVGTGPYLVDEVVPEVSISYVRNPDYWNPDAFDFDTVTFTVFSDNIAALNALKSGQIDATAIDASSAAEAEGAGFAIREGTGQFVTLTLLDRDGDMLPPLADVRVRQAINLAFDRAAINEALEGGYGAVSSQPFTDNWPGYVEGGDERYGFDLDQARELMAEAGYADGFDLIIPTHASSGAAKYEPIVQQSLSEIGIRVTYEPVADGTAFSLTFTEAQYPVALQAYHFVNTVRYLYGDRNELVDDLITVIDEGTVEEAEQASTELGEYLVDEAWFAPILKLPNLWATTQEVDFVVGFYDGLPRFRDFSFIG